MAAYGYIISDDKKKAYDLARRGCKFEEVYSCFSFLLSDEFSLEEKRIAKKIVLRECSSMNMEKHENKRMCSYAEKVVLNGK